MYQVLENNCPADTFHFTVLKENSGWDNSTFETFSEACDYARSWLNDDSISNNSLQEGLDYSGYGDIIQVVQITQMIEKP